MNRMLGVFQRWPFAFAMLLCAVLLAVNLIVSPSFVSTGRLGATLATLAPFVLVGFAATPAILAGGIDISVGPLATLINCIFIAVLIPAGLGGWHLAVPLLLGIAMAVGALNGVLVAVVRLHPVVATTGVLFLLIGASLTVAKNPVNAPDNWTRPLAGSIGVVPGAFLTLGAAALVWFLLKRTAFVSNMLATGESDSSAYGSGVNVTVVRILSYTLGGLFAGIAGIALSALMQATGSSLATTYALLGLAAAVLGGATLGGGRGGLLGTFFGAVAIYLLQQLLTSAGVQPNLIEFTYGLLLIFGVVLGATLLRPRVTRRTA